MGAALALVVVDREVPRLPVVPHRDRAGRPAEPVMNSGRVPKSASAGHRREAGIATVQRRRNPRLSTKVIGKNAQLNVRAGSDSPPGAIGHESVTLSGNPWSARVKANDYV
jgi:hypothetical protein